MMHQVMLRNIQEENVLLKTWQQKEKISQNILSIL
jgi:hypothetical protein